MSVAVVDTGVANIHSVVSALGRLGAESVVTSRAEDVRAAERVILPGVGSAGAGMAALTAHGLVEPLRDVTRPLLGICLGMQMMFAGLGEANNKTSGADTRGLGLFGDDVDELDTHGLPLPHMGWNTLETVVDDPLLDGVREEDYVYFVHSFAAPVSSATLAAATYGSAFSAVVRQGNRMGCQFHPERSGTVGARILENFLQL